MSFLQRFETELQKTACLPREAGAEIEHFGLIQSKPCDWTSSFEPITSYRCFILEHEGYAPSDDAHTTDEEGSEEEWLVEPGDESG